MFTVQNLISAGVLEETSTGVFVCKPNSLSTVTIDKNASTVTSMFAQNEQHPEYAPNAIFPFKVPVDGQPEDPESLDLTLDEAFVAAVNHSSLAIVAAFMLFSNPEEVYEENEGLFVASIADVVASPVLSLSTRLFVGRMTKEQKEALLAGRK